MEDEKRQVVVKIRSILKDQSLRMVEYSRGVKDYEFKLVIHQQNGKVLSKMLKVDVNDGVEARLLQIQDELISKFGSQTFSFYVGKKEIKIINKEDLREEYLDEYTQSV